MRGITCKGKHCTCIAHAPVSKFIQYTLPSLLCSSCHLPEVAIDEDEWRGDAAATVTSEAEGVAGVWPRDSRWCLSAINSGSNM